MKKSISFCLITIMMLVFSIGDAAQVYSAQTLGGSIGQPEKPEAISTQYSECMPNAALVMFRVSEKPVTKKQTLKALSTGEDGVSDISIKDLWTFRTRPELSSNSSGKRKFVRDGSNGEYVRVALVKSKSLTTEKLIKALKKRSDVKYAEPNFKVKALSISDDPYSDLQWSMQSSEASPNVAHEWDTKGVKGSEKIVAVVDTGVDYTHPDLKDNMWENTHYPSLKGECGFDFIEGDDDPMDENGHGSHCAGIIGAVGNNQTGISGVNQDIRIMALRVLDEDGSSYLSHEIAAYNYVNKAIDLGEPVTAINNSWGGGDYSSIFAELIDIVGEKGAITVCAAGNDGEDNDAVYAYPSCIDSQYLISVAATREDGKLANFSNYGRETVDVAAPGTDVLSTVCYSCYNPTLYGDSQAEYSSGFNDYENEGGWEDTAALKDNLYLNGEKYSDSDEKISIERCDSGFTPGGYGTSGHSVMIEGKGMKEEDLFCVTIPYEISEQTKEAPWFSVMIRSQGSKDEAGIFAAVDVPQGSDLDIDAIIDLELKSGFYVYKDELEHWSHMYFPTLDEDELREVQKQAANAKDGDKDPLKREVVLLFYAYNNGNVKVNLDDMGISVENPEGGSDCFGKYDFMTGTSMAAPYVSGAVALKAAELGKDIGPETLANEVVSMAREEDLAVIDGRSLDFRKRPDELSPRMGKITVDQANNTITIHGSGLASSSGTKVEIGDDDESFEEADIVKKDDRSIVVKNEGWINNIETVKITGYKEKTAINRDIYLVKGKKTPSDGGDVMTPVRGEMTTDGKKIFWTDQETASIMVMDPKAEDAEPETYAAPDQEEIFGKKKKDDKADYHMEFCSGLSYCNGSIYSVVEYGMSDDPENIISDDFFGDFSETSASSAIYSGEFRLIRVSPGEDGGVVKGLGKLPEQLEKTAHWTMAAYNGKLYFMGGYSYNSGSKGITKNVWIYDPASNKWSKGPAMPEGRAGGKALQTGGTLIYTMGSSDAQNGQDPLDQNYPANLIFDGTKWKKSSVPAGSEISPVVIDATERYGGTTRLGSYADISLVKGGLLYTGLPAENYGDIFTYQSSKDAFTDSGYNFIEDIADSEVNGIAVGGTFYGFVYDEMYTFPVQSGLINVSANKEKHGKITGTGAFVPGNTVKVTVKADANYRIKSLKLNGKTVKLKKNQTSYTLTLKNLKADQKITASFEKYKFKVTVSKKGKGKVTGAGNYLLGKKAKIKIKASKGWHIKSVKVGKKSVKIKKNAKKKTIKVKKDAKVKVVFAK